MLVVNSRLSIPREEFELAFARSSGPGGQNVNKVNSKVQLRWSVATSPSLPLAVRARFLSQFRSRITNEGEVIIVSQRYRDQGRNVEDCLEKLREMVATAAVPPTIRKRSKPSRAQKEKRLQNKREVSAKKQNRQRKVSGEE